MKKIRITRGGCGICYTDANGVKRHALKTPENGAFECGDEQADRLVRLGVAAYVGSAEKPAQQADADLDQTEEPEQTVKGHLSAEDLEGWDYNELKKLMPNVAAFNSDNPANPYMEGEVNLGMIWNGSAFVARQAGTPIDVVWPKEGGIFWMDSLAIPANAKNKEGALKLINFLLRPDVAKQVAETIGYPTPNLAARKLLSPEVANDKTLYPDAETIKNGEWQNDVGAASSIYEEYYQKLKAGR